MKKRLFILLFAVTMLFVSLPIASAINYSRPYSASVLYNQCTFWTSTSDNVVKMWPQSVDHVSSCDASSYKYAYVVNGNNLGVHIKHPATQPTTTDYFSGNNRYGTEIGLRVYNLSVNGTNMPISGDYLASYTIPTK